MARSRWSLKVETRQLQSNDSDSLCQPHRHLCLCSTRRQRTSIPRTHTNAAVMDPSRQASLFQVYLRLRPPIAQHQDDQTERFLTVEQTESHGLESSTSIPTHVTLQPPNDGRKRGLERFGFTQVFEESASQLDIFQETGLESIIQGVLLEGRDGLVATLGVTGSGKVGSK